LEVFERRPCLGGQQWSMKGRHPKTFTRTEFAFERIEHREAYPDTSGEAKASSFLCRRGTMRRQAQPIGAYSHPSKLFYET
jgi:hypothetical protein